VAKVIDMKALAVRGAAARISELRGEISSLLAAFPGLRRNEAGPVGGNSEAPVSRQRRRSRMSAAQRRAVSARMKAYWAQRRRQKDKR
jgi:hypothetical protein